MVSQTSTTDRPEPLSEETPDEQGSGPSQRRQYLRFGAMILTSTVVMFLLTSTNSYAWSHVRWSEERVYMALLMGGAMAVVMLGFMWRMHASTSINVAILAAAIALARPTPEFTSDNVREDCPSLRP